MEFETILSAYTKSLQWLGGLGAESTKQGPRKLRQAEAFRTRLIRMYDGSSNQQILLILERCKKLLGLKWGDSLTGTCKRIAQAIAFHPRAWKLMQKGKNFIVVADDEPYFLEVYAKIREHELQAGRWTDEDEYNYDLFRTSSEVDHD